MASSEIPVIGALLKKIFGTSNERFVKRYTTRVDQILELEPEMRKLSDAELRAKTAEFRQRHDKGAKRDDLLVEIFAAAREAMDRHVGIRNIFNPEHNFDADLLPSDARGIYDEIKARVDTLEPIEPVGEFLGCAEAVPARFQVDIPVRLYEAVREIYPESRPPFRARPFDVQLIGGMVLSQGKIAEMKTGEGKTIVAPLACYLACVERMQAHVVTVNDYLVQRDRDWTFPFFWGLGLTVGAIHPQHQQPEDVKRDMYMCDVVYGTTSEFGFDYLRDNMKRSVDQQVQRKRQFAIVDEVDSILIDEARTPLIISGLAHEDRPRYETADKLAQHLVAKQAPWQDLEDKVQACKESIKGLEGDIRQVKDKEKIPDLQKKLEDTKAALPDLERQRDQHTQYYELILDRKQAHLTHEGISEAQRAAGVGSFYVDENMDLPHLLEQSLRGYAVYERDRDYIVMDVPDRQTGQNEPSVVIVDTNTGRPMIGRQWSDGLHQAVEAKEGVPIKPETQTVATVTIQNYFKMYKQLAGMTGTADTEAQEFHDIYKLDVVAIPTNKPIARHDHDDLIFLRAKDKWDSIVDEIKHFHDMGRPILVGTTSVGGSELLSRMLTNKHQVKHSVLNAKQHEREANVVEEAGHLGSVMIATNMAGRGTDIKLGKITRESQMDHWLRRSICSKTLTIEATDAELRENVFRKVAQAEIGIKKREAEEMDFAELEAKLMRAWAERYTWLTPKQLESLSVEELANELDATGRFKMHRIRWFDSIENMGGLHVIGTERHEARRIDNQLRGRSGRQGDNGSSRFFVSFEDDLVKTFAGETMMKILPRLGMKEGDALEHPWLSKNIERAQKKVEERNFQIRKNILEYDEVMEHQRQYFYGLRQRVLEGRDVKGLIFEYIEDSIDDAIGIYLDPHYRAQCAADYAKDKLDCSILSERLRGRDRDEMEEIIRTEAKQDVRGMIDVTLGEYMPMEGSEVSVDFDSAGLVNWAKSRFDVEIDAAELREGGASERREVARMLEDAASASIDRADLSGLEEFADPEYGAQQLSKWVTRKFGFEVSAETIIAAREADDKDPRDPILDEARELYRKREIEYPVEFVMEMTMVLARQSPEKAFEELGIWSKRRFNEEMPIEEIKSTPPAKIREKLLALSEAFVESGEVEREIKAAMATSDDDALDAHLRARFDAGITPRMRYLEGEERENAVQARVENLLRTEQLHFERTVLLETLDTAWKDHLYDMDQLRSGISFRAFSQQDPRIAYKREGARMFQEMLERVRDRVTDYIFKARISPMAALQQQQQQQQQARTPSGAPLGVPGPGRGGQPPSSSDML